MQPKLISIAICHKCTEFIELPQANGIEAFQFDLPCITLVLYAYKVAPSNTRTRRAQLPNRFLCSTSTEILLRLATALYFSLLQNY